MDLATDVEQRVGRARERMAEEGIGTLLVFGSGQHNMLRTDQVFYLTDFRSLGPAVLVLPRHGQATLLTSPDWDAPRAQETAQGVRVCGVAASELVSEAVRVAAGLPGRTAVGGRSVMPLWVAERFEAELPEAMDADTLVTSLAACRTPAELERVTRAATIADEGFRRLCEVAEPGMWEYELAAEVEAAMQHAGSEDNFGLIAADAHNVAIRAPQDRRLERGDLIIGEITPCYRGYLAQLCRTLVLGAASDLQRKKYDLLIEAQQRSFDKASPGTPSAEMAKAANAVLGAAGYAEYCRQPYMRTRGHGLGLGGVVPYDINEDSGVVLQAGMTMVIHPNQYIPETGYMMLGDTVVIEAHGPRKLTQTATRLFEKAV